MPSLTQRLGVQRYEADQIYKEALAALQKRDNKTAIARLNDAIRLLPTNAEYWAARGLVYYNEGTDDLAQAVRLVQPGLGCDEIVGEAQRRALGGERLEARVGRAVLQPERPVRQLQHAPDVAPVPRRIENVERHRTEHDLGIVECAADRAPEPGVEPGDPEP